MLRAWLVRTKIKGKKRKYRYRIRWEEPILDERGELVLNNRERPQLRRRQEYITTTDKATANALKEQKFRQINGLDTPPEPEPEPEKVLLLSELGKMDNEYLTNRLRSDGTIYLVGLTLKHFIEVNGDLPVNAVGPNDIERFIAARRAKGRKPKTINRELGDLRAIFNRAVDVFGLLDRNCFAKTTKLAAAEREIRVVTPEEETKLFDACADDPELDLFIRLAFDTGARCGELAHLQWTDINVRERTGLIKCTATWKSKTRRNRPIAWTEETAARLAKWRLHRLNKPYLFIEEGDAPRGCYYHLQKKFKHAVKKIGIPHCTLHDIRRTVGTRLAEAGINEAIAAAYLGHTDIHTTAKFYQKIRTEVLKDTVDKMRRTGTSE